MDNNTPLIIYGAGRRAEIEVINIKKWGFEPSCFCDSDVSKQGTMCMGLPVKSLHEAKEEHDIFNIYITAMEPIRGEILAYLLSEGILRERIINFREIPNKFYTELESELIEAYFHTVSYNCIEGWARCKNNPSGIVRVSLIDKNRQVKATIQANHKTCGWNYIETRNCLTHFFTFYGYLGNISEVVFETDGTDIIVPLKFEQPSQPRFSLIHSDDYIFHFIKSQSGNYGIEKAVEVYFSSGEEEAAMLKNLCLTYYKNESVPVDLLEFACGYGRLTRYLDPTYFSVTASDIHEEAVSFIQDQLGVSGLLSQVNPRDFIAPTEYDVVFALSLFSHLPDSTFGAWLSTLYKCLREKGLLIFTTHGKLSNNMYLKMEVSSDGFGFKPTSEQKDLEVADYGTTVSEFSYVIKQLKDNTGQHPIFFSEGFWFEHQDLYIVRKESPLE